MKFQTGHRSVPRVRRKAFWGLLALILFTAGIIAHLRRAAPIRVVSFDETAGPPAQALEVSGPLRTEPTRILIDPGHGGRDPGAIGPGGLMEKEVVLDISIRLAWHLRAQGYAVSMTRTKDEAVALSNRARLAEEKEADLLISVHVNALPVNARPFVETFYFQPRQRHRYRRHYAPAQWEAKLQTADRSRRLAEQVQQAVLAEVRAHNPEVFDNGVRTRGFRVLRSVSIPAVLAELTVLTVPEEESRLRDDAYRGRLAEALAAGVQAYLEEETGHTALSPDEGQLWMDTEDTASSVWAPSTVGPSP